ncbi:MAG: glycosyltransferase family 2 protein [Chitinophagaceae bacterium]
MSVIILAKNEQATIVNAVSSALLISRDVVVVDSGSIDETRDLAEAAGARVLQINWPGFGQARNTGAAFALHDAVFCLDADEVVTPELARAVNECSLQPGLVYGFRRRNFLGNKEIRFGEWGHDHVYRMYNKTRASWNHDLVHENIVITNGQRKKIAGSLLHYTTAGLKEYGIKLDRYARLSAEKYYRSGKKTSFFKLIFSPAFNFVRNYLFRLGFLDGKPGLDIALLHAGYTRKKYAYLRKLREDLPAS